MTEESKRPGHFAEFRALGKEVASVNAAIDRYLNIARDESADTPNQFLTEYTGHQMLNAVSRVALERFFALIASGEINTQHGYDEDKLTETVVAEIIAQTGVEEAVLVPTGTAANLDLISSFVAATDEADRKSLKFIACQTEHTLVYEGAMLSKTGISAENMMLLAPRQQNDGLIDPTVLAEAIEGLDAKFIFQIAIPTVEGVIPPLDEFKAMIATVKNKGGTFLLDGARLTNALVYWGLDLKDLKDLGIDGFTFGTSKKGGLAEVVGIYDPSAAALLKGEAKSFGHTSSKMSPLSLVTGVFMNTDIWRIEAESENTSARTFALAMKEIGIEPFYEVCSNVVFIKLPPEVIKTLEKHPEFGMVYSDYGPDGDVTRVVFTGYQSQESMEGMITAVKEAMKSAQSKPDELASITAYLEALTAGQTNNE